MKFKFTLIMTLFAFVANSQTIQDSVSNNPGYTSQSFYSLANGEVANIDNKNWDISFSTAGQGADGSAIWLNELNGDLWAAPVDTSAWVGFDTTNYSTWKKLANSDEEYKNGAFNKHRSTTFDMGWGTLNPSNNFWTFGDSLYLWKSANDDYKKIWIVSLKQGEFIFKYADIDGSNLHTDTVKKSDYPNRNFIYYSIKNNMVVDREPDSNTWELTFTGQKDELFPGYTISSVQVFSNRNIWIAKAFTNNREESFNIQEEETAFTQQMNNIGREWKNFSSGQWSIYDTIAYFVYDIDSVDLYKVVFKDFTGSATGKSYFFKEKIVIDTASAINDLESLVTYSMYPNPAQNNVSLLVNLEKNETYSVNIYNLSGQKVFQKQIENQVGMNLNNINISTIENGLYILEIKGENFHATEKLQIK